MKTEIIDASHGGELSPRQLARVMSTFDAEGVIAYPTDTVYALGCAIGSRRAMDRIYRAKQMREHHKLALLCADMSSASTYAHFSQTAFRVARRLFPGPYTLILPATSDVPRLLLERRRRRVGVRIPDHPIPRTLLRALGRPLLTSSAIPPGSDTPCTDADSVMEAFGRHIDLLIDGGPCGDQPSTVLEVDDDMRLIVVREGLGPVDDAALAG
jgi:tRNA threonylcarbamoyl adenosine modification protein (Sua5/YciO/YrdC/YwlC family)